MKNKIKMKIKVMQCKTYAKIRNLMIRFIKFLIKGAAIISIKQKYLKKDIMFLYNVEKEIKNANRHKDD